MRHPGRGGLIRTPPRHRLSYQSKLLTYKVTLKVLALPAAGQMLLLLAKCQAVCLPLALPLPIL